MEFETKIKRIRHGVYKEIILAYYANRTDDLYMTIPKTIIPGPKALLRCCIFKERAIVQERIRLALEGVSPEQNSIQVIDIACDECPVDGITVLDACRGCLSHECKHACPKNAISIVDRRSVVDHDKCIECGKCVSACPYNAIILQRRPCVVACKADAITIDQATKGSRIDDSKCVECGACLQRCPFGAISNASMLVDVIKLLKNKEHRVVAIYAPALEGQFDAPIGKVVAGMKQIGFDDVREVAYGADITLKHEVAEWNEKQLLLSSCCPAFVKYVRVNFPELAQYVSDSDSPMVSIAKLIKEQEPETKVVFISPCTAKVREVVESPYVDAMLSFEELSSYFDAFDINLEEMPEDSCTEATAYGKGFARCGNLASYIEELADGDAQAISMNGLDEVRRELLKLKFHKSTKNFFEGMACNGGCVNGALVLWHRYGTGKK